MLGNISVTNEHDFQLHDLYFPEENPCTRRDKQNCTFEYYVNKYDIIAREYF